MGLFVGLDVSLKRTSVCMIDKAGKVVWLWYSAHIGGGSGGRTEQAGAAGRADWSGERVDDAVSVARFTAQGFCGGVVIPPWK